MYTTHMTNNVLRDANTRVLYTVWGTLRRMTPHTHNTRFDSWEHRAVVLNWVARELARRGISTNKEDLWGEKSR